MRKATIATARQTVQRRYPQAVVESCADSLWRVYAAPLEAQPIRHVLGKGLTPSAAWGDAAGRCIR